MTFSTIITAYVLGGLTFLPLLALGTLVLLYYTLPIHGDESSKLIDSDERVDDAAFLAAQSSKSPTDGAASATFAVLRRYDFQSATTLFKELNNASNQTDGTAEGKGGGESISVYQSMYRSVFDRNKTTVNPMQEGEHTASAGTTRAKARGKLFYIVLRHGHLMLYDSAMELDVRHVISLAHYTVSLQDDMTTDSAELLDAELFAKRTAIVLTAAPERQYDGTTAISSTTRKPFYLFCNTNIEKEDFYHALLSSITEPPIPRSIEPENAIKLQSALHSNSLSNETRALNALLGRIFLGTHQTPFLEAFVRNKIEKKIARIQKPNFIASIVVRNLTLGDAAPIISNFKLQELNITGETLISLNLKYTGGVNLTMAATAKLDLGQRFKTRMVSLLLAVVLQRIQGKMLIRVKPPPSNRIWFCFEAMPEMDLKIEPVVSSRQITYAFVLRAIEARIREAFAEGMVKPNWDDVPFLATNAQIWRGGIWMSEGQESAADESAAGEVAATENPLSVRNAKASSTQSLPVLLNKDEHDSVASSGVRPSPIHDSSDIKRRKAPASLNGFADGVLLSAQTAADKAWTQTSPAAKAPKSMRSPSYVTSQPLVAVDDQSADAFRASDATVAPTRRRWIGRGNPTPVQKRDAAEVVRQVRDRDTSRREEGQDDTSDLVDDDSSSINRSLEEVNVLDSSRRSSEPGAEGTGTATKRTMAGFGSAAASLPRLAGRRTQGDLGDGHSRNGSQDSSTPQQRKTILATTAAATNAARQWTWNAVANRANRQQLWQRNGLQRQGSRASNESDGTSTSHLQSEPAMTEPIGRGQPLPPPGVPLPGPSQKGLWTAAAAGLGGIRRKQPPKLPARRPPDNVSTTDSHKSAVESDSGAEAQAHEADAPSMTNVHNTEEGEFGPWMANDDKLTEDLHAHSGQRSHEHHEVAAHSGETTLNIQVEDEASSVEQPRKKVPPRLPPRRRAEAKQMSDLASAEHEAPAQALPMKTLSIDSDVHERSIDSNVHGKNIEKPNEASLDHASYSRSSENLDTTHIGDESAEDSLQSPTPPDLIDLDDDPEHIHTHDTKDTTDADIEEVLTEEHLAELDDDVQAIPAPVDIEAERSGLLELSEQVKTHHGEHSVEMRLNETDGPEIVPSTEHSSLSQ